MLAFSGPQEQFVVVVNDDSDSQGSQENSVPIMDTDNKIVGKRKRIEDSSIFLSDLTCLNPISQSRGVLRPQRRQPIP